MYDGASENDKLFGTFCGYIPPPMIRSSSRIMYVKFTSYKRMNIGVGGAGFVATYFTAYLGHGKHFIIQSHWC